jgi:hypothetical protein
MGGTQSRGGRSRRVLPSVAIADNSALPSGQLVWAPLSGFMMSSPSSAVLKSVQADGESVEAIEPQVTPLPHGAGRSLVRSTICMSPFEPVPYAK